MTCRRAFELDLAAFVVDPHGEAWAGFRAHHPACPDCAGEVRAWTELQLELRSGGPDVEVHPAKDLLLRYEDQRAALPPAERQAIESHVAACCACADELRALRRFDFSVLGRAATTPRPVPRSLAGAFASWVRGIVWHPAFAYALVLLLLYPAALQLRSAGRQPAPAERIALETTGHPADPARRAPPEDRKDDFDVREPTRLSSVDDRPGREAGNPARSDGEAAAPAGGAAPRPQPTRGRVSVVAAESTGAKGTGIGNVESAGREPGSEGSPYATARADESGSAREVEAETREDARAANSPGFLGRIFGRAGSNAVGEPRVLGFAETEDPARPSGRAAVGSEPARASGEWRTLHLAHDRVAEVRLDDLTAGLALRVPSSDTSSTATRTIDVRIAGPDGREAAQETLRLLPDEPVEVRVASRSLSRGTYRVVARDANAEAPSRVSEFLFLVR